VTNPGYTGGVDTISSTLPPARLAADPKRPGGDRPIGRIAVTAVLAGLAGAVAVWILIGIALLVEKGRAVDGVIRGTVNLARTMQESLDRRIEVIDARLRFAQALYARDGERFEFGPWAGVDPGGRDVVQGAVITLDGRIRHARERGWQDGRDLLLREDLRTHLDRPQADRLVASAPLPDESGALSRVSFSRPLRDAGGALAGFVLLSVDAEGLTRLYESLYVGPGGVALIGFDGVFRACAPPMLCPSSRHAPAELLAPFSSDLELNQLSMRYRSPWDGVDRFVTLRRLESQPLLLFVGRDADAALLTFGQDRQRLLGLGVMISALIALVVALAEQKRATGWRARTQLEALVENIAQGVIMSDRDGKVAVVNGRARSLLALPRDLAAPGRPVAQLLTRLGPEAERRDGSGAAPKPLPVGEAQEHVLPEGTVIETRAEAMPDGGMVQTFTDVTAQRRARDALAAARDAALAAEAALAAAMDNVPQGILLVGADRRLRVINRQAVSMLGLPPDLARAGVPVRRILEWQVREGRYEGDPGALADAMRGMTATRVEPSAYERRMPDGRLLELRTIALADGGGVRCYTDITERRRQEHALAEAHAATLAAEAALSAAIENVPQGILLLSPEGTVRVMNRHSAAMLGLPPELARPGIDVREIVAFQRDRGEFDSSPELAARAADPEFGAPSGCLRRYERVRPDGTVLEVRTVPTADGGAVRTFTDVTERRRVEEAMAAARDAAEAGARARTEFLAVMSHEIRTPLNAVIGLSGLLQDATLPPEQAAHARLIREAGDHLLSLVNDILDFSSLESGRLLLEETPFDPRAETSVAVELLDPQARAKGLAMRSEIAPDVPARVVGDPGRLRQVLLNLLNNAVKFTDRGSVRLSVRTLPAPPGRIALGFEVQDSGIGIPAEAARQLFSAFRQVDASTSRRFGGTGLGLAISRQLVERMGGSIAVESEPGVGSIFRFNIMFRAADPDQPDGPKRPPIEPAAMPRLRILLAEDNTTNRLVLTHRLEQLGHRADAVSDGREALEAARERPYDLIIMDMMMPGMDGLAATRAIRALPGQAGRIPIIGLTAAAMPEDEAACLDAGMDGYERKPIGTERLRAAILAASRLRAETEV
jgi:signal transduction histidine kinase/ActR/RegA family two-component response regulator